MTRSLHVSGNDGKVQLKNSIGNLQIFLFAAVTVIGIVIRVKLDNEIAWKIQFVLATAGHSSYVSPVYIYFINKPQVYPLESTLTAIALDLKII